MKTKLKFDTAWLDSIQTLGDAEQGRLLRAYIAYALGETPPELKGNERYVWATIKAGVDEMNRISEVNSSNVKKRWDKSRNTTVIRRNTPVIQIDTNLPPSSSPSASPLDSPSSSPSDSPITTPYNPPIISHNASPSLTRSNTLAERFDRLWELYPKKQGKKQAFESYKRAVRDGSTDEEIEAGIKAYTEYAKNKDSQFIKQGSTFFRQKAWEDDWKPEENIWIERIKRGDFDDEDGNGTDTGDQGGDVPWWELFDRESDQRVDDAPRQLPG